jgi:hypothetical protein
MSAYRTPYTPPHAWMGQMVYFYRNSNSRERPIPAFIISEYDRAVTLALLTQESAPVVHRHGVRHLGDPIVTEPGYDLGAWGHTPEFEMQLAVLAYLQKKDPKALPEYKNPLAGAHYEELRRQLSAAGIPMQPTWGLWEVAQAVAEHTAQPAVTV